jgi:hypothetical protein
MSKQMADFKYYLRAHRRPAEWRRVPESETSGETDHAAIVTDVQPSTVFLGACLKGAHVGREFAKHNA